MPIRIEPSSRLLLYPARVPPPGRRPMTRPKPAPAAARLQRKLEPGDEVVAYARAWVSRAGRLHGLVAARHLDYAVLTDRHLYLITIGFFTRRPRRRIHTVELDHCKVSELPARRGRRLRVFSRGYPALLLEMRATPQSNTFADRLLHRTHRGDEE
jgi:hypothetical protein